MSCGNFGCGHSDRSQRQPSEPDATPNAPTGPVFREGLLRSLRFLFFIGLGPARRGVGDLVVLLIGKPDGHDGCWRKQSDGVDYFAFPRRREIALRELVEIHAPSGAEDCDDDELGCEQVFEFHDVLLGC